MNFTPSISSRSRTVALASALLALTVAARALPPEPKFDVLVPLKPENVSLGHFPYDVAPILTVKSGTKVKIDGGGGVRWGDGDPAAWLKENGIKETLAELPALTESMAVIKSSRRAPPAPPPPGVAAAAATASGGGHTLVGPIAIEGAEPGDSVEIRILDVRPRIPYGFVSTSPGRGGIPDLVPRPFAQIVKLDTKRDVAIYEEGVEVPLRPFMGVMALQPSDAEKPLRRSSAPGNFGGNLDLKELVSGATLYLPVNQKGGLFYTGDSHAAQGDGEVTITAVETANSCVLQFILHKGKTLKNPRAENATHFISIGLDPDLNKAMRQAITETIDYLGDINGYDFFKAFTLSSIGVDFRVTQVVDGTQGIHGMIPKAIFKKKKFPYWYQAP
ncbi:MAG: acetamidase/formamidase family protein [Verrucomicrobia bacterium]|nr:acetamidase/formamidase family protein [Verrucomicrobiota bacterium]